MAEEVYRIAGPADWPAIAALVGRDPAAGPALERYLRDAFAPGLAQVAVAGERLVGAVIGGVPRPGGQPAGADTATAGPAPGQAGRIAFVGVAAEARRRGIGRRLLQRALAGLGEAGARRVEAEVEGTQVEALALFRAAGFDAGGRTLRLVFPPPADGAPGGADGGALHGPPVRLRPLTLADLTHLSGLLIRLGIERAQDTHDDLPALTPVQVEAWLSRPATVAFALWEAEDPSTPLALAWATRRPEDALLRFIGVQDDVRRQGHGRALIDAVRGAIAPRALRADVHDPGPEEAFFRHAGGVAEHVVYRLSIELSGELSGPQSIESQPQADAGAAPRAVD